jgi:orotidine-5'-phosphate decarboxylase|tara:strand:+ start:288 stop:965 length:678 start_codon:yes stop_codon:yes gene_type:complete
MVNKNIFVACDISTQKEILDLLELIHKDISGIKIGLQYITQRSPEEIRELSQFKKPIFYDGKFFDIKNTLTESIKSLEKLNVSYATVHLLNGLDALKAANKAAHEINLKLLGVSVLTSFDNEDLKNFGFQDKLEDQIKRLIKIAMNADLYGVICSPLEVRMIKNMAPNLKCFTPGIRMPGTKDEQKRTMSANEAIREGSDCLIIGRPITKGNPKENIKNIISSIE